MTARKQTNIAENYNVFSLVYFSSVKVCTKYAETKNVHVFTTLRDRPFENIVGNGENTCYQQFLLFPQCFRPFQQNFGHIYFVVLKCLEFGLIFKS